MTETTIYLSLGSNVGNRAENLRRAIAALENAGVRRIYGGGFCTYTERERFFSYRRDRGERRMAAAVWLTP